MGRLSDKLNKQPTGGGRLTQKLQAQKKQPQGFWGRVKQDVTSGPASSLPQTALGVLKGGGQTVNAFGNFLNKITSPISNRLTSALSLGNAKPTERKPIFNPQSLEGKNTYQNIGIAGEKIAEFAGGNVVLAPLAGLGAAKTAIKYGPLAGRIAKGGIEAVGNFGLAKAGGATTGEAVGVGLTAGVIGGLSKLKGTEKATWNMIQPKLTPTELRQAVVDGKIVYQGPLRTITQIPSQRETEMIKVANKYISNATSQLQAVSNMQQGISSQANALSQGLKQTEAIFSGSQIQGALNKLKPPTMVASDTTLSNAYNRVVNKMLSLTKNGGKLEDLLQARKQFDDDIAREFPNLYNSDTLTPMRIAIKNIRNAVNDTINSRLPNGTLPNGVSFKESLKMQSLLYDAIENVSAKVSQVGSNSVSRFMQGHPLVRRVAGFSGAAALGAVGGNVIGSIRGGGAD